MCYFNSYIHLLIDYDKATEGLLYGPTFRIWGTLLIGELYQLLWMDYLPQILFFEIASQFVHIVTNDVGTTTYQLGTPFSGSLTTYWSFILKVEVLRDHLLFFPHKNSGVIHSNAIYYFVPNISFFLEPLCKILQETKVLQNLIEKCNHTLIEHFVVPAIAADKFIGIGVSVQKHTSHSWWDFFFTTSLTAQKLFSALFNLLVISLIILLLTFWNCYLTYRINKTTHVILPYSSDLQPKQSWSWLLEKLKWSKCYSGFRSRRAELWPCFWPSWTLPWFHACPQAQLVKQHFRKDVDLGILEPLEA